MGPIDNKQVRVYDDEGHYEFFSVDEIIARRMNQWKGWRCSAGVSNLYVDYDQNVWVCNTASTKAPKFRPEAQVMIDKRKSLGLPHNDIKLYEFKPVDLGKARHTYFGYLGNIHLPQLPKGKVTSCPLDFCTCGADVIVSKEKELRFIPKASYKPEKITGNPTAVRLNTPITHQILWDLGRNCNYDCSYCWPAVHNRTDMHLSPSAFYAFANNMINNWSKGKQIQWCFGGGEPTLHPLFDEFVEHLHQRNQWVLVTSNGSRDHKYWMDLMPSIDSVNLSAHFEFMVESRFLKTIEAISTHIVSADRPKWLEIKIMATPHTFDKALALRDKITEMGVLSDPTLQGNKVGCMSMVPLRGNYAGKLYDYTPDQMQTLQNQ
jgi:Radical SAM superfamily